MKKKKRDNGKAGSVRGGLDSQAKHPNKPLVSEEAVHEFADTTNSFEELLGMIVVEALGERAKRQSRDQTEVAICPANEHKHSDEVGSRKAECVSMEGQE